MNRLRLQVLVNGRELCIAGLDDTGSLAAKIEYHRIRRPEEPVWPESWAAIPVGADKEGCRLEVSGHSFFTAPSEDIFWLGRPLSTGDEVTIRILGPGAIDAPKIRELDEPF